MKKVILVEDTEEIIQTIKMRFADKIQFEVFKSSEECLNTYSDKEITADFIILDYHLPGMNGLELFKQLKPKNKSGTFIGLSSTLDGALILTMVKEGLKKYIIKDGSFLDGLSLVFQGRYKDYLDLIE